ncbi:histidinol-phosphate transaminase [Haloglycomyces albus]|uniref:histidinol-phosphate transaminase n=1 Tax=Haloglycomyces albus TaxID=526067 RepID=UPI00046D61DF|nr:histidinol-phosphate transaminase [Haloglycomyces albus]
MIKQTSSPLRADLDAIPAYVPGKTHPDAVKLSSNEMPFGPLPGIQQAVMDASANVHRYPDMGVVALRQALARRLGVTEEQVATGSGSVGLLQHLLQAIAEPGAEVVHAWRSFEAYPILTAVAGVKSVPVPNTEDHRHDLPAMARAVGPNTRAVIVCNPNNPTGQVATAAELDEFVEAIDPNTLIIFDEAYQEFVTSNDVPDAVERYSDRPNVVVARTFSKAWGMAGLRAGYMISSPDVVRTVSKCILPFSVNMLAQVAATAALEVEETMRERVAANVVERQRVLAATRDIVPGVPDTEANFVWLPLGDAAADFAAHCTAQGVIVRPFAGDGVRVTVGLPEENDLFLRTLASFES